MNLTALLLGSNLNNSLEQLAIATDHIDRKIGSVKRASSIYGSQAWGKTDQPDFLNQVLLVASEHPAQRVLDIIHEIETSIGRVRKEKWEARIIDIDILYIENKTIQTEKLIVPHPLLHERMFTLVPLAEILPDWIHPIFLKSNAELLNACPDFLGVYKLENSKMKYENLNIAAIHDMSKGNEQILNEIIALYIHQTPTDFHDLEVAVFQNNNKEIASKAHYIKPTMEYIGAKELKIMLDEIEKMANIDASSDKIKLLWKTIDPISKALIMELKHFELSHRN